MYLKYSIDLQSTQEKRDKEKERKRNGKRNKRFKTYRGRVDACTLHVAVSDHCCTCTNLWVHRVFYMPWFHLFDVYIQWKKKGREKVRWKRDSIALCIAHPCYTRADSHARAHTHWRTRTLVLSLHWWYTLPRVHCSWGATENDEDSLENVEERKSNIEGDTN